MSVDPDGDALAGPPSPRRDVPTPADRSGSAARIRIVVLGGGFGGVAVTRHLQRMCGAHRGVEITLVSRDNFFVLTPLLFEACSGRLELRHCAQPIRPALRRARFVEATLEDVDVGRRVVHAVAAEGLAYDLPYDHMLVALGATTNQMLIPGSESAFTFKTMVDALVLRNHVIERFERADAAPNPALRRRCLTFVVVGGGLVGVELLGELTAFADDVLRYYPSIRRNELRFLPLRDGRADPAGSRPEVGGHCGEGAPAARGRHPRLHGGPLHRADPRPSHGRDHRRGHHHPGSGHRSQRRYLEEHLELDEYSRSLRAIPSFVSVAPVRCFAVSSPQIRHQISTSVVPQ